MGVADTSRLAYHQIDDLGKRQRAVYAIIEEFGPITNLRISQLLNLPQNSVTGRTNELVKKELVENRSTTTYSYGDRIIRAKTWVVKKE